MTVADQLQRILERMARACQRAGRDPGAVQLVAVSKKQPPDKIRAAYAAGQRVFGENYGQELRDKAAALAAELPELRWHFVGPVQSNKVRYVAAAADLVHTVERPEIAAKLLERAERDGRRIQGLVEINIACEPQKAGVLPAQVAERVAEIKATGLPLLGLMCMPPFDLPMAETVGYFRELRRLGEELAGQGLLPERHELSMGMSDDFEQAIAEGATIVRVGTAIFGARGG